MVDYPDWTRDVDIVAQTISKLDIDIVAQTLARLDIDIVAQTLGQVNVNIAASAVTLNINIASSAVTLNVAIQSSAVTFDVNVTGSVAINIQTSGGTNIVIDKLTQGAVRGEFRKIKTSDLDAPDAYVTLDKVRGCGFPRGCRGLLDLIGIWLKNVSGSAQNVTFHLRVTPDGPDIASSTYSVPDDYDGFIYPMWTYVFDMKSFFWVYDSLFLVMDANANVSIGRDTSLGNNNGFVYSSDAWYVQYSYLMHVTRGAVSVGELPISGTVTAVLLPEDTYLHGGLYLKPDEAARKGTDKNFYDIGTNKGWGEYVNEVYIIPAGKTLYITGFSITSHASAAGDYDHFLYVNGYIQEEDTGAQAAKIAGVGGAIVMFNKPMVYIENQRFQMHATNYANVDVTLEVIAWGYEI